MTLVIPRFNPGGGLPGGGGYPGGGPIIGVPGTRGGFEPPIGGTIPGTPFGAGVCPPGTRCVGPSINIGGGLQACLGTCSPYPTGGQPGRETGGTGGTADIPETGIGPIYTFPENGAGAPAAGLGCQSGYRPNKSSYWLKDGTFVAKGSRCVKSRRRDLGNIRALRRADRRVDGFVSVARSALKHTGYKVVSKGAGRGRGSAGVITRREASRALAR